MMKQSTIRKYFFCFVGLWLLPFSACTNHGEESSKRPLTPKYILEGSKDAGAPAHSYLDFYIITSSEVELSSSAPAEEPGEGEGEEETEETTYYAVALKDGASPSSIVIPATYNDIDVVGIMPHGFRYAGATSITFEGEIKVIDYEAFLGSSITSVNIPWSIKKIGDCAFYDCRYLTTVRFNSTDKASTGSATTCGCTGTSCGTGGTSVTDAQKCPLTNIPQFCFYKCSNLTTLTLPASLEEIEYEAFSGCSSLSSTLSFQNNFKTIRERAFEGCRALRQVYIPTNFFTSASGAGIEQFAFYNCDSQLKFTFYTTSTNYTSWNAGHPNWGEYGGANPYSPTINEDTVSIFYDTDWEYSIEVDGVHVRRYTGAAPTHQFLVVPDYLGGEPVRRINSEAFDAVKSTLTRLYLPTKLYAIENNMFGTNYPNLIVIDSNDHCSLDWDSTNNTSVATPQPRIDLSHLIELQFIGYWAFCHMSHRVDIEKVHLPANLIAIGNEAFCRFAGSKHMDGVKEFLWDFNESTSRLQVIGTDAFHKIGVAGLNDDIYGNESYDSSIKPATIVFPKTFKYFGMRDKDVTEYATARASKAVDTDGNVLVPHIAFAFSINSIGSKWRNPAHCFQNSPLIGNVIFKGSMTANETADLVVPNETFAYCENLQRVIFEERNGHFISLHTQNANYAGQSIGSNGVGTASFRGRPFLQTVVLPTKHTKVLVQKLSLFGNPRAVMYLSGSYGNDGTVHDYGMYYDDYNDNTWSWTKGWDLNKGKRIGFKSGTNLNNATWWQTIGDESYFSHKHSTKPMYMGYCFATNARTQSTSADLNKFGLDQKLPYYENVHYKGSFTVKAYVIENEVGYDKTMTIDAEVGESGDNSLEYKEIDDCVYLCGTKTENNVATYYAIMANYLYRLWPNGEDTNQTNNRNIQTVVVKKTITIGSTNYTVTEIGDSAFSAAHCDGPLYDNHTESENQGSTNDLQHIKIPNTIKRIGDYAFMRAYGVTKISAYESDPAASVDYNMPSSLETVGKNAFSFCNVEKFLNFPDNCLFYENSHADYNTTSVFTNNFSLRQITFKHGNNSNQKESNKYITSTYLHGSEYYTTALYSKGTTYNQNRLLIILNRDTGTQTLGNETITYFDTPSEAGSLVQDFLKAGSGTYPTFEIPSTSDYAGKPFLYGAYKMAYWLKSAHIGYCTTSTGDKATSRSQILNQPLFSGVCSRSTDGTITDQKLKLGVAAALYTNQTSDLKKLSGEMFDMPLYGFNGCENLKEIALPDKTGGVLPEGLFANVTATNTKYSTEDGSSDDNFLDLTGTGYAGVGVNTFQSNASIKKIKAPAVSSFSIGAGAFKGCSNLEELDLSPVTGDITISSGAFESCGKLKTIKLNGATGVITLDVGCFKNATNASNALTIDWPTGSNAAEVHIKESAFESCNGVKTLTLPANTREIGKDAFKNCSNLESVAFDGNDANITALSEGVFYGCGKLDSFDFGHLTSLTTIGKSSFNGAGKIATDGKITFASGITTFGQTAFASSKLVEVTFTCSSITLGTGAFSSIGTLKKVRFTNSSCGWDSGSGNEIFKDDGELTDLQLPTGFSLGTSGMTNMILSDTKVGLYSYHTFSGQTPSEQWRKFDSGSGTAKPVIFYAGTPADLDSAANLQTGAVFQSSVQFWKLNPDNSGNALYLGTLIYATSSLAIFSEGYAMDSSGALSDAKEVNQLSDIVTNNVLSFTGVCWTRINNTVVPLGTASYNSGTGVVTFSSDYTLDSNGFHAPE